ncbi:MAG TPA: YnfA family protein [Chryseosolibacter sp.]|nr:YnfA family protein [Chryseosolibacter sp.]
MIVFKSIIVFILAGICEIGGGFCIWLWLREGKSFWYGIAGALVLVLYGIIATYQPSNFARVYATYGGFFIVMSLAWGYALDNFRPDRYDVIGAIITLIGVGIIYYAPRG